MEQEIKKRNEAMVESGKVDWGARARGGAPLISEASEQTEADRQVPDHVVAAMHDAELFRMCLPRSLGGGEATPLEVMEVLEIVAGADASTAWCLGQLIGCSLAAGYLDPDVARDVFGAPNAALAWGPTSASARVVAADSGFRVSGQFRFASGSRHATWLGAHCAVFEADGTQRLGAGGKPVDRTVLFPISAATMDDVWRVVGLKGTGSDNYTVDDLFVPESHSFVRDTDDFRRETGPLYRIPFITFYGIAFAGVALGIARAMLDEFIALAAEKVPARTTSVLRESPIIQSEVAMAQGRLGSSRAYLVEMAGATWETAIAGEPFPLDQRALLRVAISYAMNQAREVAEFAFRAAGTNAIFEANSFERRFRDMYAVSQQSQANLWNFESAGQALLGLEPKGGRV